MKLKKTVVASLIMTSILNSQVHASKRTIENSMGKTIEYIENNKKILVSNIEIKWLNENTIFYLGADMPIEAYVNEEAVAKDIIWRVNELDNKSNVIKLYSKDNNKAILEAMDTGRAEIMVLATDDSNSTREITINVKDYLNDDPNKFFISNNIKPIQSRNISQDKKLLQVEVNRNINYTEKINTIDTYLSKLAKIGKITSASIKLENEDYEFYNVNIMGRDDIQIEVRVDKHDDSYNYIKDKLINIEQYNESKGEETLPEEPPVNDNNLEDENDDEDNNIFDKVDKIIVHGGEGTKDNPVSIEVNKKLTSQEKIEAMNEYLQLLQENNNLEIVNIRETSKYSAYKIKVSEKILKTKNDFYIEIIVDKEDKKSYKEIIFMLNKIDKNDKEDVDNNDQEEGLEENTCNKDKDNNYKNTYENNDDKLIHNKKDEDSSTNIGLKIDNKYNGSSNFKYLKEDNEINLNNIRQIDKVKIDNNEIVEKVKGLKQENLKDSKYLLTTATGTVIGGLGIGIIKKRRLK